jgi:hypothetical protein
MSIRDVAPPTTQDNPFKGQESYSVEDAGLFFGRDRESTELTGRIVASRLTVLHAPSGAGKTSLLNARIIPALEANGLSPIRSKPDEHPVEEIRRDALHWLFPPIEAEELALEEAMHFLGLGEFTTVRGLLAAFDDAAVPPQLRRRLLAPVANQSPVGGLRAVEFQSAKGLAMPAFERATPYVSRVLRKTADPSTLLRHLHALRAAGLGSAHHDKESCEDLQLGAVRDKLSDPSLKEAYRALVSWLANAPEGLRPFFTNLLSTYGAEQRGFAVVLILDQFEQIFTLFGGDPAFARTSALVMSPPKRNWRLREKLFSELNALYGSEGGGQLPIRFVFSLREEYVGRLTRPFRHFADLDAYTYRLGWLSVADARKAISKPPEPRYTVSTACENAIVDALTIEDDSIEPGPLQIVCYRLWHNHVSNPQTVNERTIEPHSLGTNGVRGLLRDAFGEFLKDFSDFDRLELLDMLAPLITSSGTRNIVERSRLIDAHLRDSHHREHLLEKLESRRVVRRDTKGGGTYYEIMHEFLIEPLLVELTQNVGYRALERALRDLTVRLEGALSEPLSKEEFQTLVDYRDRLRWSRASCELMLRNAVFHRASAEIVRYWARRFHRTPSSVADVLQAQGFEGIRLLSAPELHELRGRLHQITTPQQALRVAKSLIAAPIRLDRTMFLETVSRMRARP